MQVVPIHLILSGEDVRSGEDIKKVFIPLNGAFNLQLIFEEGQLETHINNGIEVVVYAAHSGISWQECSRRIRNSFKNVLFILMSDEENNATAITQGADLLVRSSEAADLPILIASLLKRHKKEELVLQEIEIAPASSKAEINELQLKNKELKKINFELDRFVYSASHDLRAPLTSVLGLLYLIRLEMKDEEAQRLVNMMEESILKLDNTIRDIVAYSRNNRTEVQIEPLRIGNIIEDVLIGLKYMEDNQVSLSKCVRYEDEGVFLSDKNRLSIILTNLISNAIRYRHPARVPEVMIKVHRDDSILRITVADNGMGINEKHLGKIFEMFYRTSDHSTGSGLGLYIVKETIKKLEGNIEVNSKVNEGSIFRISLPILKKAGTKQSVK
ncbi:MAG: HAMP domain-containing sensor histidine kinase [Bacteroidia bacterium]